MKYFANFYKTYTRAKLENTLNMYREAMEHIQEELEHRDFELHCLNLGYGQGIDALTKPYINEFFNGKKFKFRISY